MKLPAIITGLFLFLALLAMPCSAADTYGLAESVIVEDTNATDSGIVCASPDGYSLCKSPYDPGMYGVINLSPAVLLKSNGTDLSKPVVTSGKAYVLVNTQSGDIKVGDYITTSTTPGVGQKATKSGYIIGVALQGYVNQDKNQEGRILVSVNIKPTVLSKSTSTDLVEVIRQGIDGYILSPINALRYLIAALIVTASVFASIFYFGRIAKNGITALGRNPLAGKTIYAGIILNVILTIVIMGIGVGIAYLILTI